MRFADVGNGMAVLGPEIPALIVTLVVLASRTSRVLTGIAETIVPTEKD